MLGTIRQATELAGICDCHIHVFDSNTERFPFAPGRTYTPPPASLEDLKDLHQELGVERMVIVQASPYGNDNRCLESVLQKCTATARGVAVVDPDAPESELRRLHDAGVRGLRINLETAGLSDPKVAEDALLSASCKASPLGWHVQTYTNLGVLEALADLIQELPVPLVIDHFGRPDAHLGISQPGFKRLLDNLSKGNVYIKLSAPYRISQEPDYTDVTPLAQAFIEANANQVLWGTDWPHPGTAGGARNAPEKVTPFRKEDNKRALARLLEWAQTLEVAKKILVDNPARLYDF